MAKMVVTGGAGFIGSHLAEALLREGHEVTVLDNFLTGKRENLRGLAVDLVEGDVRDAAALARGFRGAEVVFHQAALPSVPRSIADPLTSHDHAATGTLRALVAAREAGVRRFLYAGSSSAYGDAPTLPRREDQAPMPLSPYAVAKLAGEHYCRAFHRAYGFETVVLRYFNAFGPRQDPASPYAAVVPKFLAALVRGEPPVIHGDGEQSRDFTYVENVVAANLLAARALATEVAGEVFNAGAGGRTTVNHLLAELQAVLGTNIPPRHEAPRPGDVRHSHADIDKARRRFHYSPQVALRDGLKRTASWFLERRGSP